MTWYSQEEKDQIRANAREALASANVTLDRAAARDRAISQRTTAGVGLVFKTKEDARIAPKRSEPVRVESVQSPAVAANETVVWWQWVQEHVNARFVKYTEELTEALGEVVATERHTARKELQLLRRELAVLRTEVGVRALQKEVAMAREQIPAVPAIEARLDAENRSLKVKLAGLERELAKTKDRLGRVKVDQSVADYSLRELRKQVEASGKASIEMEFESKQTHFQVKASHPDAARALQEFAGQIIHGQKDGVLWLPPPAGNA
jgi:hypothetical protein